MNTKSYNLTNKNLNLICNHCGSNISIKKRAEIKCPMCMQSIDLASTFNKNVNIQSEEYYIYLLKAALINKDEKLKEETIRNLTLLDSKNDIFLHIMKRKALKNIENKEDLDFIVEYLIIQNEEYSLEDKKKQIRKTDYKDEYLKLLSDDTENEELVQNLFEIKEKMQTYDEIIDNSYKFGYLFLGLATLISILIFFLSKFLFNETVLFASIIVVSSLPTLLFSISILKFIKIKNIILKIIIFILSFIIIFLILSFLLSLRYNQGNINEIINNYIYHLKNCLKEINEAINSAFGGQND